MNDQHKNKTIKETKVPNELNVDRPLSWETTLLIVEVF